MVFLGMFTIKLYKLKAAKGPGWMSIQDKWLNQYQREPPNIRSGLGKKKPTLLTTRRA